MEVSSRKTDKIEIVSPLLCVVHGGDFTRERRKQEACDILNNNSTVGTFSTAQKSFHSLGQCSGRMQYEFYTCCRKGPQELLASRRSLLESVALPPSQVNG